MIIYKISCNINGKAYIGQTIRPLHTRWKGHIRSSQKNHNNNLFHNAINKYKPTSFTVEIIACANSKEGLNQLESYYIEHFNTLHPNGYNSKTGGAKAVYSKLSKKKMSEAKLGVSIKEDVRLKMSATHKARWKDPKLSVERSTQSKRTWKNKKYREKITNIRKEYWSHEENRVAASIKAKEYITDELKYKISKKVSESFKRPDVKLKLDLFYKSRQKAVKDSNNKIYSSIKEAANILGVAPSSVLRAISNKRKCKGLSFEYCEAKKTIYIICGVSGSGKSWVCNQLTDKFTYISYDKNKKSNHLDLIDKAPFDKPVLYDLSVKTSTMINKLSVQYNVIPVFILGDFLTVKQQLKNRGGTITASLYKRWQVMHRRAKKYGKFTGSSSEVLKYLQQCEV